MHLNYLAFAVPLFLAFIGLEYLVATKQGKTYFRFNDTVLNLSVGIAERLADTFTVGLFYFVYRYLYEHYALFSIRPSVLLWVALLLCTDFVWYWYHRLAHEVTLFWCAHVVHHQSEEFNYTVSARITVFQAFLRTGFWAILPVVGFPPGMITSMLLVHGLYPFFIHTRTIGKLGVLEYILVTPSHHRVHHASNPQYLDRNYGDVFIIWDKLFGTFTKETEEPVYGLTKPLNSNSFLWQHFHFVLEMVYSVRHARTWGERFRIVFGRPDNVHPAARAILEERFIIGKDTVTETPKLNNYVIWQIAVTLLLLFSFLLLEHYVPVFIQVCISMLIVSTLINCGAILEQKRWVFYLEYARFVILVSSVYYCWPQPVVLLGAVVVMAGGFYFHGALRQRYLNLVYRGIEN
ncbi:Sterol desaturase/sphingolipid hydroxylase, fatty acid hydroxylase superfamily [Chitinophaga jiangningensis]|uniref:Sterol desaturase/sphingolipid hydroxylase, fatty acid hydroxylase superfamily n=1 Tax=Chitinophaga jiangningensis TaxID=1419482 RepID=A0A1M7HJG4_9BACT|nr:sterol desaturase family protein [Chitinophaga jiangningensis]SHM28636.1 Sterol desaturase/sphingolipid hydroxylase, fatty acid hydroxylase superfamily [Chitinophaga jiangningensis]